MAWTEAAHVIPLELIREFEQQMKSLRIGETSMGRAQKLEKLLGIRRLHLKLEGENPSGTHKDRVALLYCLDARTKGQDTLTAVSCGNYGAALAFVAGKLGMKAKVYIPADFAAPRKKDIESFGGEIVLVDGDYEASQRKSRVDATQQGWYDANPGGKHCELSLLAYTYIAKEIARDLGRQPDWVSVPVGNGEVIAGVWEGFRSMGMKPRMLGCSNNNSAVHGVALGEKEKVAVADLQVTEINEPLCGNFLTNGESAIAAMLDSGGTGIEIPDQELVSAAQLVMQEEGIDVLPASAGAVWGITKMDTKNHVFVAVMTGRGH